MKFEIYRAQKESEIFEICGEEYDESKVSGWFNGSCRDWVQQIRYKHWVTFVAGADSDVEDARSLLTEDEFWPTLEGLERTIFDLWLKLEHPTQVIEMNLPQADPEVMTGEVDAETAEVEEIQWEKKMAMTAWVHEIVSDCENVDTKIGEMAYDDASLTVEIRQGILDCLAHCGDSLKILKLMTDSTCDDVKDPRVLLSNPDWYDQDQEEEEYIMEDESAEGDMEGDIQGDGQADGQNATVKPKSPCLDDERKWVDVPAMDTTNTEAKKMKPQPNKLCATLGEDWIFSGEVEKSSEEKPIKFECCAKDPNISRKSNGEKSDIQEVSGGRAILSTKDFSERKDEFQKKCEAKGKD